MYWKFVVLLCALTVAPEIAQAQAPAAVRGKSVVVTVSEQRTSHPASGGPTTAATATNTFSVYISSAGRPFVRSGRTLSSGGGSNAKTQDKAIDTAPGGGTIGVSVASNVQFSGNSMIINMAFASGARRVAVTFDGSSGCTGSVINGKSSGQAMVIHDRFHGYDRVIDSMESSVTGCSVRDGNVFGGQ
jgi:hypothetical protein